MAGTTIRTKKVVEFIQELRAKHDRLYQEHVQKGYDEKRIGQILLLREIIGKMEAHFGIDNMEGLGMKFIDEDHRKIFVEMKIKVLNDYTYQDLEYDTSLYVLAFLQSRGKNVMPYLNNQKIDFNGMRENLGLSTGERALLDVANVVFNGYSADIHDTLRFLSGDFRQVAFEALMKRY